MLLDKKDIINNSIPLTRLKLIEEVSAVYFLIHDDNIIYIGQSMNIKNRVGCHKSSNKKDFYRYYFIVSEDIEQRLLLESDYIEKFNPIHNHRNSYKKSKQKGITIIANKIDEKFGTRYNAANQLGMKYAKLNYWYKTPPKEMSPKLLEKIAKALELDSDWLKLEILKS